MHHERHSYVYAYQRMGTYMHKGRTNITTHINKESTEHTHITCML